MTTANYTSIARPYARAAFEFAAQKKNLQSWEAMLFSAAAVSRDKRVMQVMSNPNISKERLDNLFCDILASILDKDMQNFIRLLAKHKRLPVLPNIAAAFKLQHEELDKKIDGEVFSPAALTAEQLQRFTDALSKRLQLKVTLANKIDASLIGGVVIHVGDMVIDGSVSRKLKRMLNFI